VVSAASATGTRWADERAASRVTHEANDAKYGGAFMATNDFGPLHETEFSLYSV
jgi:hypothetical protein